MCPKKYKFAYIDKLPRIPMPADSPALRGNRIHDSIEHYLLGEREDLDPEIQEKWGEYMFKLKNRGGIPEQKFGFTDNWDQCDFDDPDAMVRGLLDAVDPNRPGALDILEWKTGREYPEHAYQRSLYAVAGSLLYPDHDYISVTNVYLDKEKFTKQDFTRAAVNDLKRVWKERFATVLADDMFIPMPQFMCKYCDYSKQKGGPCAF